jgi:hypothetical protein
MRKDGIYVKATTYHIMDRSKTAATSNNKRPFNPEVKIGWFRGRQADVRQAEVEKLITVKNLIHLSLSNMVNPFVSHGVYLNVYSS